MVAASTRGLTLRVLCSLFLGVSAVVQVGVEASSVVALETVAMGTVAWACASIFAWTSNAWWLVKSWRRKVCVAHCPAWAQACDT
jgi:hypothetical protein